MRTVYLTQVPSTSPVRVIVAIKSAMKALGTETNSILATQVYDHVAHGASYDLGSTEDQKLADSVRDGLEDAGCQTSYIPESVFSEPSPQTEDDSGETEDDDEVSVEARELGMWLIAQTGGDPLKACLVAAGIYRVLQDDVYREMILSVAQIFPWLEEELIAHGMVRKVAA